MLTNRHLVLVRAALMFWDEEMSPHGAVAFTGYVDGPVSGGELTGEDVRHVRQQFDGCMLRYALCDEQATQLIGEQLFQTVEEAESAGKNRAAKIVTVLVQNAVN